MDSVLLGEDVETREKVFLNQWERREGLYVAGKKGMGKSNLLVSLALQDIKQGLGLCFLDSEGDAIMDIISGMDISRVDDVILLEPFESDYSFGLNPFSYNSLVDPGKIAGSTAQLLIQIFQRIWRRTDLELLWDQQMTDLLQNTILVIAENPFYTLTELPLLLRNSNFRMHLLSNVTNEKVIDYWEGYGLPNSRNEIRNISRMVRKINGLFTRTVMRTIFGQTDQGINFRYLMDESKILLVRLPSSLGVEVSSFLGAAIIDQILMAALTRMDKKRGTHHLFQLYIDEYRHFAIPLFAPLSRDARMFALATTVAEQKPDRSGHLGYDGEVTLYSGNLVIFRVDGEDGGQFAKLFYKRPSTDGIISKQSAFPHKSKLVNYISAEELQAPNPNGVKMSSHDQQSVYVKLESQVASDLISLKLHRAHCRIMTDDDEVGEFTIRTFPHEVKLRGAEFQAALGKIRSQTYEKYGRQRSKIEAAINQRQRIWIDFP